MSNSLFNVANEIENLADHTEVSTGFDRTPPAAGMAVCRFVQYIELGNHVKQFDGKDKPSSPQVRVGFELHGRHVEEQEVGGVVKKFHPILTTEMGLSLNSKASFKKLFNAMLAGRSGIINMAQMLGEAFLMEIVHTPSLKDPKRVYAGFKKDGAFTLRAPVMPVTDEMGVPTGEVKAIKVPEATEGSAKVFLWDNPSTEQWDSLFIDGTYEQKDGDTVKQVSKNFLQETILSADNFAGSAAEAVLQAGDYGDLTANIKSADGDIPEVIDDGDAAAVQQAIDAVTAAPAEEENETVSEKTEEEMMKELGLA